MALIPGRDYSNTCREFVEMFPDGTECMTFLARLRWSGGFICPKCKVAITEDDVTNVFVWGRN